MNKPIPIQVNFKDVRTVRQKVNNMNVYNSFIDDNKKEFNKNINQKEFIRTLDELSISFDEFWIKCREDTIFAKLAAGRLSICASRQGGKDEKEQLRLCNIVALKCGVNIKNLSATALRCTKDGKIITNKKMKQCNISKNVCLKSFDAKITGKCTGYISAKISFGNGGHQDNVFEELDTMAELWRTFKKDSEDLLILLIDTDLIDKFENLGKKYKECANIYIFNHYDFQKFIIDKYYKESI